MVKKKSTKEKKKKIGPENHKKIQIEERKG